MNYFLVFVNIYWLIKFIEKGLLIMGIIANRKDEFDIGNFEEELKTYNMPVVVDFFASWCGPCKMLAPIIESVMEEYEGMVRFVKVDIDLYPDLAEKYEIQSVPTLLFFNGKELVRRESGFMPAGDIIDIIETEFSFVKTEKQ